MDRSVAIRLDDRSSPASRKQDHGEFHFRRELEFFLSLGVVTLVAVITLAEWGNTPLFVADDLVSVLATDQPL